MSDAIDLDALAREIATKIIRQDPLIEASVARAIRSVLARAVEAEREACIALLLPAVDKVTAIERIRARGACPRCGGTDYRSHDGGSGCGRGAKPGEGEK